MGAILAVTIAGAGSGGGGVVQRAAEIEPPLTGPQKELVSIAREFVRAEVRGRLLPLPQGSTKSQPVFVTIEVNGTMRGCRGNLQSRAASLQEEVALAAKSAAAHDPRYKPLQEGELKNFRVTVTLVQRLEPFSEIWTLQPSEGLVLQSGGKTGIVLPWEGKLATTRLYWAYQKAGLPNGSTVDLQKMYAERFRG